MTESGGRAATQPGTAFVERYVEADGFRVRYLEAGRGRPLVHLHGAGGPRLSRAHDLLAERYRVIAFEVPGFGKSAANERSGSLRELARTMATAMEGLGLERYNLWGTSFGGKLGLWLAIQFPQRIEALVLEAPNAIRPEGHTRPSMPPEERARLAFAHPDRQPPRPPIDPVVAEQQETLVRRLRGPNRDQELERQLGDLRLPVLVLFGTEDRIIPSEMGRHYPELLPSCHFVLVYDAGHAIGAERPEAFTSVVSDFLERREQFVVTRTSSLIHP